MQRLTKKAKRQYRKWHPCRRNRSGFTLTEVLVASMLLLIAMVPLLKALTQNSRTSVIVERRTQSLTLAQSKLSRIKAQAINSFNSNFGQSNQSLSGSYLCNVTQATDGSDLKNIIIIVGHDRNGNNSLTADEYEVTLQTKIARR